MNKVRGRACRAPLISGTAAPGTAASDIAESGLEAIAEIPSTVPTGDVAGDIKEEAPVPPPYEAPPPYEDPIVRTNSKETSQTDAPPILPSSPKNMMCLDGSDVESDSCVPELVRLARIFCICYAIFFAGG